MIFVDESIQKDLDYICVGFAFCDQPPDEIIRVALTAAGLTPGKDEYKSGYRMRGSDSRHALRDSINQIVLEQCRLGLYIAPLNERPSLLTGVAETASKIVQANGLQSPQRIFVDQEIIGITQACDKIVIEANCDSRQVSGIQLADYVAYHCSYLLKCTLNGYSKKIQMGEAPHPYAGEEVDLDWLFRTDLRRHFFAENRNVEEIKGDDWFFKVSGYGVFLSEGLNGTVRRAAEETFDTMYYGCVF